MRRRRSRSSWRLLTGQTAHRRRVDAVGRPARADAVRRPDLAPRRLARGSAPFERGKSPAIGPRTDQQGTELPVHLRVADAVGHQHQLALVEHRHHRRHPPAPGGPGAAQRAFGLLAAGRRGGVVGGVHRAVSEWRDVDPFALELRKSRRQVNGAKKLDGVRTSVIQLANPTWAWCPRVVDVVEIVPRVGFRSPDPDAVAQAAQDRRRRSG